MLSQVTTAHPGDGIDSQQSLSSSEWNNLFSAPLNPTVFAALAANGVLSLPPSSHMPTNPSRSQYDSSTKPRAQMNGMSQQGSMHGQAASWSQSPYLSSNAPPYMQKPSMTRRLSTNGIPRDKGKSPVGNMSHFQQPSQLRTDGSGMQFRSNEHHMSDAGGSRRQSIQESAMPQHAGPSRRADSRVNHRNGPYEIPSNPGLAPRSPAEYHPSSYSYSKDRSNAGLPPSLWMSPTSTAPSTPGTYAPFYPLSLSTNGPAVQGDASSLSSYGQSPLSSNPSIAIEPKSTILSDIFSDDLFDAHGLASSEYGASSFTSQRLSGSPDLKPAELGTAADADPEALAKEDPLATQVWKMYARTKATLPHAQRMENLTWRMMALALKKKKEDEAKEAGRSVMVASGIIIPKEEPLSVTEVPQGPSHDVARMTSERGRGRDKTKVVVGFDGANQDGDDDDEYVS